MMPNMNGWDTLKAIRKNKNTEFLPVIMLTAVNEDQKIVSGLKIGADDYIVKPFILPNLLARIEAVLRRSNWQKEAHGKLEKKLNKEVNIDILTPKEKEVLTLVAKGASNQEIADKLCVRDVTVKTHLNSVFKKLKVTNRTQAVLLAMQIDLIN
jgi:DNA-binding NarL/FixJ family response regulator